MCSRLVPGERSTCARIASLPLQSSDPRCWCCCHLRRNAQAQAGAGRPRVIAVSSVAPEKNAQLSSLIAEIRSQTDAFVFLSGGASRMREDHQQQLLGMFEALALIAKGGRRIAVGMVARRRGSWKQRDAHGVPAATRFR